MSFPVAGPGFPREGCQLLRWVLKPIILKLFPENCMEMKEFGPRWGVSLAHPLGSATAFTEGTTNLHTQLLNAESQCETFPKKRKFFQKTKKERIRLLPR